jgi:aspartate/methionine/tyrosine aminotransferase
MGYASGASTALEVPRSKIRELADLAFSLDGVLKLHFGESNLPTPQYLKDAANKALAEGYTFYTENAGLPSLRGAIAEKYRDLHQVGLDPCREIVVTASGVQALNLCIRCALNPGDEALLLTPAWPNGSAIVRLCSASPREIPLVLAGKRLVIDYDRLEAAVTNHTKLLIYTSPSNPLGWVATQEDQRKLLDFCRRHGLWLLADEVYERIFYADDAAPSVLRQASRDDPVMVVQSFSKSYCMTGWRLGWLVARRDLACKATELNEFVVSHAPTMAQKAGEAALREGEPELRAMKQRLEDNLRFCIDSLSRMQGVTLPIPEGAFYLFPRIERLTDSLEFCRTLLLQTRVALAPGVAFGAGGEGSVRICYAADRGILEQAMERLGVYLKNWE